MTDVLTVVLSIWFGGALASVSMAFGVSDKWRTRAVLVLGWPIVAVAAWSGAVSWSGGVTKE